MSSVQKPPYDSLTERAQVLGHAWWPHIDTANQRHVWQCTCSEIVYQLFGAPVPDELISHPQSYGQLRGWDVPGSR